MKYLKGQTVPSWKDTIVVHCLATSRAWGEGKHAVAMMREVTDWHVNDRGWSGVGYAAIVDYQGRVALGRDLDSDGNVLEETAAAARGWNKNGIHISLAGGRGGHERDSFEDHYTADQDATLRAMIAEIEHIAGRKMKLIGHNEVAAKACPCFQVSEWFKQKPLKPPVATPVVNQQNPLSAIIAAIVAMFRGK